MNTTTYLNSILDDDFSSDDDSYAPPLEETTQQLLQAEGHIIEISGTTPINASDVNVAITQAIHFMSVADSHDNQKKTEDSILNLICNAETIDFATKQSPLHVALALSREYDCYSPMLSHFVAIVKSTG